MRTYIKKVFTAIKNGEKQIAKKAFDDVQPILDRFAIKNLIHKNKAAKYKSRFSKQIKEL
jgi:small subunit ribosomal protein S20